MPGKAFSATLKARKARARHDKLMAEAVAVYRVELVKPEGERLGARIICEQFRKKHAEKTGEIIPLSRSTLMRLAAGHQSIAEFNATKQWLTDEEEETVSSYLAELGERGFPLNLRRLKELVDKILRTPGRLGPAFPGVGQRWADRFVERHHDKLAMYWSAGLESKRGHAREHVIGKKGKKIQHQQRNGDRETITVIPAICADGTTIPPAVIYKGQGFQVKWLQDNPLKASLGYSKKGWTDSELGVEWIKHFDQHTKAKSKGRPRLLLVDGHNSHCTLEFLQYAQLHNIHILCYPAHTTHIYQALDVGVFSVLKRAWTRERDNWERTKHEKVSKQNFLAILGLAWVDALTPGNIKAAFRKTSVWPYDPSKITPDMLAPSRETAYRGSLPLAPPTPIRILADAFGQLSPLKQGAHPTETTVSNSLQELAQETRLKLAASSAPFLVTSSPIKSTSELPSFIPPPSEPAPTLQSLTRKPETQIEKAYLEDIQKLQVALEKAQAVTRTQSAMILVQSQYCETVREQLATSEKPRKPSGKLAADGMPRLLTDDAFVQLVEEHAQEQKQKEVEAERQQKAREEYAERLRQWREQDDQRKARNKVVKAAWKEEVELWEAERDLAKEERRRPRWTKPLLKGRLEKAVPKPRLALDVEDDGEWVDIDEDASSDDER
ncbi:hypothetical protein NM688_g878 [Phlebia brevispora]|uniref:Uncharacterized protein n=1 Tax=Phlebia brevispora TaxID=194682 RepID=A0ACC1TDC0_9APHY|nr:hypothetical protein NM688_g878 [Phlebia brevispora]